MVRTIGLVLKPAALEALEALGVVRALVPAGRLLVEDNGHLAMDTLPAGVELVSGSVLEREAELVIVLGGDGTLIHAASLLREKVIPILGVNLGHVGFLTDCARDELPAVLPKALANALPHLDRMRLDVSVRRDGSEMAARRILNDVTVTPPGRARLAHYRITHGGELVTTLRADGVIVATPTGSTAYSLAAGGSILSPGLHAILITPVCPHSLTQRPIVVDPTREVSITLESGLPVCVAMDGGTCVELAPGDVVSVRVAPVRTRLLAVPWRGYFQTLRAKLGWGDG